MCYNTLPYFWFVITRICMEILCWHLTQIPRYRIHLPHFSSREVLISCNALQRHCWRLQNLPDFSNFLSEPTRTLVCGALTTGWLSLWPRPRAREFISSFYLSLKFSLDSIRCSKAKRLSLPKKVPISDSISSLGCSNEDNSDGYCCYCGDVWVRSYWAGALCCEPLSKCILIYLWADNQNSWHRSNGWVSIS